MARRTPLDEAVGWLQPIGDHERRAHVRGERRNQPWRSAERRRSRRRATTSLGWGYVTRGEWGFLSSWYSLTTS